MKRTLIIVGIVLFAILIFIVWPISSMIGSYNTMVKMDEGVKASWAQVENVYQRRMDLIPNLVEAVKGAANFEKSTLTAVIEARSKVGSIQMSKDMLNNPKAFQQFQAAQGDLTQALSKLMVVVEKYPEIKATQNFTDLQNQLEGTENRINVARVRYNQAVQKFNTSIRIFPNNFTNNFFLKLERKEPFKAQEGAATAPKVNFQ